MNPVHLNLPDGSKVYNFLYRTRNLAYLTQDVLTVELPNGYCVDVGWFPEHDPAGSYHISVFWQFWDHQKISPIKTKSLDEVIATVENLARTFNRQTVSVSPASTTDPQTFFLREHANA